MAFLVLFKNGTFGRYYGTSAEGVRLGLERGHFRVSAVIALGEV